MKLIIWQILNLGVGTCRMCPQNEIIFCKFKFGFRHVREVPKRNEKFAKLKKRQYASLKRHPIPLLAS